VERDSKVEKDEKQHINAVEKNMKRNTYGSRK